MCRPFLFLITLLVAALGTARGDVYQYTFSVTNLSNGDANFALNIDTDGLITTTGMQTLGVAQPTSLGFAVTSFGENAAGWYAFSGGGGGIYDTGLIYSNAFFDFVPDGSAFGYDVVGSTVGAVSGDDPDVFSANATLNITDLSANAVVTPEPSTVFLLGTGMLAMTRRSRRRLC